MDLPSLRRPNSSSHPLRGGCLTPEQRRLGERNLARLLVITHRQGVDRAMEEWQRMKNEMRAKDRSSPDAQNPAISSPKPTGKPAA